MQEPPPEWAELPQARAWPAFCVRCPHCEAEGYITLAETTVEDMDEETKEEVRDVQGLKAWEGDENIEPFAEVRPYRCKECGWRSMPMPDGCEFGD